MLEVDLLKKRRLQNALLGNLKIEISKVAPSANRNYVLVLREQNESERCENLSRLTGSLVIGNRTVRSALPPIKEQ
jgi:hypothetical protein